MSIEAAEYHKLKAIPSFKHTAATAASELDEVPRCQKLRAVPSFKHIVESAAEISREGSEVEGLVPRYMSLKDVMANLSPTGGGAAAPEPGEIAIRNELVKRAASAYVLSATIISPANRDNQDSRMKMCCVGFLSCCQISFLNHILHRIRTN